MPSYPCRACGAPITLDLPIPRDAECENCGHDVRSCVNCRHYDTRYNNSCRETEADPVPDKHHRNFCEYFQLNAEPFQAGKVATSRESQARAKLEGLFGGPKPGADRASDARKKLEDLFKKPKPAASDDD